MVRLLVKRITSGIVFLQPECNVLLDSLTSYISVMYMIKKKKLALLLLSYHLLVRCAYERVITCKISSNRTIRYYYFLLPFCG